MKKIARLAEIEKMMIFRNTAGKLGLPVAVVEKDFWVCYALDYLFHRSPWKHSLIFKGGTSLSKAFGLITRFSEDIDLTLDWRVLGYGKDEPWEERSKTKQKEFNESVKAKLADYLAGIFCPSVRRDISEELGSDADIHIDDKDPHTVIFAYPKAFFSEGILPSIRLEFGALSAFSPSQRAEIIPYVAEHYPNLFAEKSTDVLVIAPERTFWDKATILHQEAHRPMEKKMPSRFSRHYYDLCCLANSAIKAKALSRIDILKNVVETKMRFYPSGWARYEQAMPGSIELLPAQWRMPELEADYASMREMLYGDIPDIEEMMSMLKELQEEINSLAKRL